MCSFALLTTRPGRERLLAAALNLTANTALTPDEYERQLLDDFVLGVKTLDEVVTLLEEREEQLN